jgi:hypothetical protein
MTPDTLFGLLTLTALTAPIIHRLHQSRAAAAECRARLRRWDARTKATKVRKK